MNLLGRMAREIDGPSFPQLIEVISTEAKARGFDTLLGNGASQLSEGWRHSPAGHGDGWWSCLGRKTTANGREDTGKQA